MSRTFRQYIRTALFNKEKAAAINKLEEKLKAESKARAIAEEKLRIEIQTRAAAEQKVNAAAEQKLLTQHRRYSALAERVEAQAKEEIAKARAKTKEALEKLRSYTSKQNKEEEKLKEIKEQLKAETAARAKAQNSLKAEIEKRKKIEAHAKEEIAKAKIQAEKKVQSVETALSRAEKKLAEAKEQPKTKNIATTKKEGPVTKKEDGQNIDTQPAKTINFFSRIFRHIFHSKSKKKKVALFSLLATISIIALIFAVSVVNDPLAASGDITVTTEDTSARTIYMPANGTAPRKAILIPLDSGNQGNTETLSAGGRALLVRSSDDNRWEVGFGSHTSFDFSDVSIPANALIKSVLVYIEHCEEEHFTSEKLEWSVGKGWPAGPVVWASIKAPVHEVPYHEAVDSWDITSLVDTREKLNSLQLQVKNNDNITRKKTMIDYIYVVVEWE